MTDAKKTKFVKKLSVKTVYGTIDVKDLSEKKEMKLMTVLGLATGTKTGESNYGTWFSLTGQFRAINAKTGDVYESANVFMPDVAIEPIIEALKTAEEANVEFGFDIVVQFDDTSATKYVYAVVPLLPASASSPLNMLANRINSLQLENKSEEKTETETKKK